MAPRRVLCLVVVVLLVASTAVLGAGVAVAGAPDTELAHDGDKITLEAGAGQVVEGTTDLPPGATVSVRLRSAGEQPFLVTDSAVVDADGRFRAVFDLADVGPGSSIDVLVHHDGDELAAASGEVVECEAACASPGGDPAAELDGSDESLSLTAGPGQAVHGSANLAAGETVRVRIQSAGSKPFLHSDDAVVDGDGRFRAVFDLADADPGTDFDLSVRHDGDALAEASGTLDECTDACADRSSQTETGPADGPPSVKSVVTVDQGGVAHVPVRLDPGAAATLTVGGPEVNYEIEATVRDETGDGRVTLAFDTEAAGHDATTVRAADDGDVVSVATESDLDPRRAVLDAADYPLALYEGNDTGTDPVDVGTLVVMAADVEEWNTSRTPDGSASRGLGFEEHVLLTRRGQTVTVPVEFGDEAVAKLHVEGPQGDRSVRATVRDGSRDGRVTVLLDTTDGTLSTAESADDVTVERNDWNGTEGALPTGEYPLTLYRGADDSGDAHAVASLVVNDPAGEGTSTAGGGGLWDLLGIGALALGGSLAVVGVALLVGVFER